MTTYRINKYNTIYDIMSQVKVIFPISKPGNLETLYYSNTQKKLYEIARKKWLYQNIKKVRDIRLNNNNRGYDMPLQHIQCNYLYVTLSNGDIVKYSDNLFNRVNMLKDNGVKDIKTQSGQYIKKDYEIIHSF